jgi:D-beta-D-heptose 7-phosphate kinase/D-beta-D-heptose 1-phosphate adenosyltransferase
VFDVTGAGDTMVSMLALALAAGKDIESAAYLANVAAGLVVGHFGTSTTTLEELERALGEPPH